MTLKEARESVGLSQKGLDRKAGLEEGTVGKIEQGYNQNPTWKVIGAVIGALRRAGLKELKVEHIFQLPAEPVARSDVR